MDRKVYSYLNLLISWSVLMLLLTLIPFGDIDGIQPFEYGFMDKTVHICLFGIHAFLLAGFLKKGREINVLKGTFFIAAIILSFLFGLFIEGLQHIIPERSFEYFDLLANFIGILLGIAVFYVKFNFFTN